MLSGRWKLNIKDPNAVHIHGVDMGGVGILLAVTLEFIAVKWPSGKHFQSRGHQGYHSPSTGVFRVLGPEKNGVVEVEWVLEWEHKRRVLVSKPPEYAQILTDDYPTAVILRGGQYYRHAGAWEVPYKWVKGKYLVDSPKHSALHGREIVACTRQQWLKGNAGYVDTVKD